MSIQSITSPDGRLGYRVRVNIGKDNNGRYLSKCRTIYGTARQAQEVEKQMQDTARRVKGCQTDAEIYAKMLAVKANYAPLPMKKAFDLAIAKPTSRMTSTVRTEAKRGYWMDFVEWMAESAPLINNMQDVSRTHAEGYISFLRKNGPHFKFKEKKIPVKLANDTLNCYLQTIRQVFNLLKHETGMHENPFGEIPFLPAKHAERDAYTEDQLKTIFLKADEYMQGLFFIGLFTGLSEGDICTLKKSEINFEHHHIYRKRNKTLQSSGKISAIPMLPVLEEFLRNLVNDPDNPGEYVLPKQAEDYLRDRSCVSKRVKSFLEIDCNFDTCRKLEGRSKMQSTLDFHSLRHTFCSISGVVGIPITVVKSIVGHMTTRMTELYSRHVEDQERLRWMRLFGERLSTLPNLPMIAEHIPEGMEPERMELLAKVRSMNLDEVRRILADLNAERMAANE